MEIKRLVRTCEFGAMEETMLRDRIVMGITNKRLQTKLLETTGLKYVIAVEKSRENEITQEQTTNMSKSAAIVSEVREKPTNQLNQYRQRNPSGYNNNSYNSRPNNWNRQNNGQTRNYNSNSNTNTNKSQGFNQNRNNQTNQNNWRNFETCRYCNIKHERNINKCHTGSDATTLPKRFLI